ncbi:MAG TPA: nuclear transport factor 2 family protein [Candidatus Udaeobacter sp.]|nr:nuclear transport factor 2 family protein [Candidatus Udaeobacter sp.]
MKICPVIPVAIGSALLLAYINPGYAASQRSAESDRQALIAIENEWLTAHDAPTLERILAADFVHPVPSGDFLTRAQHIEWVTKHPPAANLKSRFDRLDVRLYGDVGIANGSVVTRDENGKEIGRNVFTDVFLFRDGRWQAINGQETEVRKMTQPER